ncbi:MAG TPA: hypothetical protein VFI72_07950 [Candidatus Angelobacter sp.]|nr:hypothetical protein [Candidatus Angelobacter sp.]
MVVSITAISGDYARFRANVRLFTKLIIPQGASLGTSARSLHMPITTKLRFVFYLLAVLELLLLTFYEGWWTVLAR